jgi:hypothetical protein
MHAQGVSGGEAAAAAGGGAVVGGGGGDGVTFVTGSAGVDRIKWAALIFSSSCVAWV